jgi:hypothetical protein
MKLFLLAALLLSGCGLWSRQVASTVGYDQICVNGVSYLQFTSGVSVEYTPDGKIKECK